MTQAGYVVSLRPHAVIKSQTWFFEARPSLLFADRLFLDIDDLGPSIFGR
jgi:hypothetical protein